jgi:bifunctional non-homologous end joining protein LigD
VRQARFVLDGEAVALGVDGVADFNALHSGRHNAEVQLYTFDILALDGDVPARPAAIAAQDQPHAAAGMPARRHLCFAEFEQGEIEPDCFAPPAGWGWKGS